MTKQPKLAASTPVQARWLSWLLGLLLFGSLLASLWLKSSWLWLDEVLSYTLLADPSRAHMNQAIVSNMDSNPPLYFNVVWTLAHTISLNQYFLRAISIAFFATTIAVFYRFTTRLVGHPWLTFGVFTVVISLTYLNFTLSTEIRSYPLYLLLSGLYFMAVRPLIRNPDQPRSLAVHFLAGALLVMTHNFGSFYVTASLSFFALLYLWSRRHAYWWVAASHFLIYGVWLVLWYASFQIQSLSGKPWSWIPEPTLLIFFRTVGELLPNFSARLEQQSAFVWLPVLRAGLVVGLFLYIALPRLKRGYQAVIADDAFSFYLLAGWVMLATALGTVLVSFTYLSVFLSRYQWPTELLILYQLSFALYLVAPRLRLSSRLRWALPLYVAGLMGFIGYQSRKLVHFPDSILGYLPANQANYPIFFESADYFLPIWHHHLANAYTLLDHKTVLTPGNLKNASTDYNLLISLREKYNEKHIVKRAEFTPARFPHFYVVDEASRYQLEYFIQHGLVKVVRVLPVPIAGHRIVECEML